jgi:hypothetical protein
MSKLVRTLMLGATLAAMSLAAATDVAQEHTTDDAAELFRAGERASQAQTTTDAAELFRAGERASQAHREEVGTPPAEAPQPARPDGASRRPGLLLALSVLIVALAAVTTTHATRRIRARQAV